MNGRATNGLTYRKHTTREASSDCHMQTAVTRAWKGECNRLLPTWQLIQLLQCLQLDSIELVKCFQMPNFLSEIQPGSH